MARLGGNLLQRTRPRYFGGTTWSVVLERG
jgi:hypothetical protein